MVDAKCLSDCKLQNQLEKLGFSPGPILPSTRKLYEKKLVQLLVSPPCAPPVMNGPRKLDGAQDSDDNEGGLQEHQAPESHIGLSPRRETTARKTRLWRAGEKKVSQWA
ncbi:LEM domain-containing protein 1 isoform X3 [Cebus imitator]|uniref:LEM domain containing 1 n=1 Tax=Cebus imitator TaxID=2715852 RepID=A0A2K5QQT6_CEBIM|nr:LEM domain-containing protein 1 isoform X3 [Cebus imitator]XP_037593285.1 LEM domain-containing protein 1 isoform X3 [Cebus imitator]